MAEIAGAANAALAALNNVTVTIKPNGLASYTAEALYTREYLEANDIGGHGPVLHGLQSELDPDDCIDSAAQVWVSGDLYRVVVREPDGTDYVRWRLERDHTL